MTKHIDIRPATEADADFIVDVIIGAERSGSNNLSYMGIYDLEEAEVKGHLKQMVLADVEGQELCISHFIIAEVGAEYAGAACAWIEGQEGDSSSLKASLLSYFLPVEKLKHALQFQQMLSELRIERISGALQIESLFVLDNFRGLGIGMALFEHLIEQHRKDADQVQLNPDGANEVAIRIYEKMGFRMVKTLKSEDENALKILPSNTKSLMLKDI